MYDSPTLTDVPSDAVQFTEEENKNGHLMYVGIAI